MPAGWLAESRLEELLLQRNGLVRDVDMDPVTRVAAALAFHAGIDLEKRNVLEAHSIASLFRGYEVILKGRDPRDAMWRWTSCSTIRYTCICSPALTSRRSSWSERTRRYGGGEETEVPQANIHGHRTVTDVMTTAALMWQAIPRRVIRAEGERALVDYDGKPRWVAATALADLLPGEYVVVYAGQAPERMAREEAEEMLARFAYTVSH